MFTSDKVSTEYHPGSVFVWSISLAQQRMCMESGDRTSHDMVNDDTTASCWSLVGNIDSKGAIVAHIIN